MNRALLEAMPASGTTVIIEAVALTRPKFDHCVLGTRPHASIALEAVPAGEATSSFVNRLLCREPSYNLREVGHPLFGCQLSLQAALSVTEVPEMKNVEGGGPRFGLLDAVAAREPGVYVLRCLLTMANSYCDRPLRRDGITAGEYSQMTGHHRLGDLYGSVGAELHSRNRVQETGVALLPEG